MRRIPLHRERNDDLSFVLHVTDRLTFFFFRSSVRRNSNAITAYLEDIFRGHHDPRRRLCKAE